MIDKIKISIAFVFACFVFASCGGDKTNEDVALVYSENINLKEELTPKEYVQSWSALPVVSEFVKQKQIKEFNYKLKYLPVEFLISNELRDNSPSKELVDSLRKNYEGMEYYELTLSVDDFKDETIKYNLTDMQEYQNRLSYLSFSMQEDLTIIQENNQVVPCKLYHYERTFGVAPHAKILIGFSKDDLNPQTTERTVVLNDNLFNKGLIKFNWSGSTLLEAPKLLL